MLQDQAFDSLARLASGVSRVCQKGSMDLDTDCDCVLRQRLCVAALCRKGTHGCIVMVKHHGRPPTQRGQRCLTWLNLTSSVLTGSGTCPWPTEECPSCRHNDHSEQLVMNPTRYINHSQKLYTNPCPLHKPCFTNTIGQDH
jgi:hypothetical protein